MHRAPFRHAWLVALAVFAALAGLVLASRPSGASTAYPAQCATSSSPYNGSAAVLVYARHNVAVRRYTKPGLSPMFIATAPIGSALPEPIFGPTVHTRPGIHILVAGSSALVGVNGDFFHIGGDNLPNGVQVAPGGRVIKGTSRWQNAAVTTLSGRLVGAQVKVDVVLHHGTAKYVGSTINDPTMPGNGLAVFTNRWGQPSQPLHTRAGWREYVVNSRGIVVAAHAYATRTVIPRGGYIVEAQGTSAVHLQMQGWRVNAHVQLRAYAHSSVAGGLYAAEGSGRRLVHNRAADRGACGYDGATTRTVVGMIGTGKTFMLATSKGRGLTLRETMAVLRWIGATEAVMFDGGGSVEMATRTARITTPLYGIERGIPSAWGLVPR